MSEAQLIRLTKKQAAVFSAIVELTKEFGYPPTNAEIAKKMGFSSNNAAHEHVRMLNLRGVIEKDSNKSRSIRVLGEPINSDGRLLKV